MLLRHFGTRPIGADGRPRVLPWFTPIGFEVDIAKFRQRTAGQVLRLCLDKLYAAAAAERKQQRKNQQDCK